jgi:hypothetical protein
MDNKIEGNRITMERARELLEYCRLFCFLPWKRITIFLKKK